MSARSRPFSMIEGALSTFWTGKADATKNAITPATLTKGGSYDVSATIRNRQREVIASGTYSSGSGVHAEIAALSECPPSALATISVNPPPCKRCAMILAYYREKHDWSVEAPGNYFAPTNAGAYGLPDYLRDDVVVGWLVDEGIITRPEAETHRERIVSYFLAATWYSG